MNYQDEAELKVNIQNLYNTGGTSNVINCLIAILDSQLVILKKLKEIINHTGD